MHATALAHLAVLGLLIMGTARRLPSFALKRPVALAMILCAAALFGMAALTQLPVELMPNVAYGNVTVFVDVRGGMPPPEVERLVTKPVEEAMGTVSNLRNLISSSKKDRSVVTLEFDPGTDMDLAAMEVREKFLRVKPKLPPEIEKPVIARYDEADAPIVIMALTSEKRSPEELRRFVDNDLKEKLLRVEGVANVEVGGGRERKIIIDVDRDRLAAAGLSIKRLVATLEQNNVNLKSGEVRGDASLMYGVRTLGALQSISEIADMALLVSPNGGRIRLRDVAEVRDSYLESESYSRLNAKSAVTVYVQKESVANTVRVAGAVAAEVERFRSRLPAGIELVTISNQRKAILAAIRSVQMTLLYGVVLVVLVLPLFLSKTALSRALSAGLLTLVLVWIALIHVAGASLESTLWPILLILGGVVYAAVRRPDLRTSMIVALSIPMSVAMTLALMFVDGISINVMSLSGLVLGIGLLVDNAVVVIENYDRRVALEPQRPLAESMLLAAQDMVGPMVAGTLTIVVVFLPFSLLSPQAQILFADISYVVTASLFSSLFVALTCVPALGSRLDPEAVRVDAWDNRWAEKARQGRALWQSRAGAFTGALRDRTAKTAERLLAWRQERPSTLLAAALASLAGLVFLFSRVLGVSWAAAVYVLVAAPVVAAGLFLVLDYEKNLDWAFRHRTAVLGTMAGLLTLAVIVFSWGLPKDYMSSSEQSEFVVFVELDTGVRLDISNKVVQEVEQAVRDYAPTRAAIKNVSSKVEGWSSKVYVTLQDLSDRRLTTQQVIDALRPEVDRVIQPYSKEYKAFSYFSEPRSGKEIFVELYGYDYDVMARLAMEVASGMGKLPGLSDVKIRYRPGRPQLSVLVDSARAAIFGLDTRDIADQVHAQMRGLRATTFFDKGEEIEAVARIRPEQRETVDQMRNLLVPLNKGPAVPLIQVATIQGDLSPSEIWHRNRARMIQVSANLGTTSLEAAAHQVRGVIRQVRFPSEYYADIGGQYEDLVSANRDFKKALLLTVFLVFMVMACQFESLRQPVVIMGTVLLSFIGAVAVLSVSHATVTMGVSVGLLMLAGIVVNNGIMLIDRTNVLRQEHPDEPLKALIVRAGRQRMRPIFMTKITTVLGLIPMALDRSESAVLWSPLALTVVGGLISSSLLTLFIIPILQWTAEDLAVRAGSWRDVFSKASSKLQLVFRP